MSVVALTILSLAFALFGGQNAVAAEDQIRVIQATGRAAIVANEDQGLVFQSHTLLIISLDMV